MKMSTERMMIPGIVKGGIVVPEGKATLPEGARVGIVISPSELTPDLRAEFAAWERVSDEACVT